MCLLAKKNIIDIAINEQYTFAPLKFMICYYRMVMVMVILVVILMVTLMMMVMVRGIVMMLVMVIIKIHFSIVK